MQEHGYCVGVNIQNPPFCENTIDQSSGADTQFDDECIEASEDTQALFGSDRHVANPADDINAPYDIVLVCGRTSGRSSSWAYDDSATEAKNAADALYTLWERTFNRLALPHDRTEGPDGVHELEAPTPIWMPYLIGYSSSRSTVFGLLEKNAEYRESVQNVIEHYHSMLEDRRVNVLIIFPGVDGLTTANESWKELADHCPFARFSLTSINEDVFASKYPSVYTSRADFAYPHLNTEDLQFEWAARQTSADPTYRLLLGPKEQRFLWWLSVLQEWKFLSTERGGRTGLKASSIVKVLTVSRASLLETIIAKTLPTNACEACGRDTSDTWHRGSERHTVRCNRCKGAASENFA